MSEHQTRAMTFPDLRRASRKLGVRVVADAAAPTPSNLQPKQFEKVIVLTHGKALSCR